MRVNPSEVTTVDELSSKQEEVDTSVILDYILLGEDWESNTELIVAFESFCHLKGCKDTDVNNVRNKMFDNHIASPHYVYTSCTPAMLQGFENIPYSII